ncbi:LysR family transcriptional regulator [Bdellovibrio sp. HCB290]|uniref:LysR family transcriptional regulator n=1 Tax=Bdellovibrio sp. HCB290 TaxID=3394356 RepID=UPI0039B4C725
MDSNTLRYFFAVATDKSFSQAARRLNAQQPSLSRAVRSLEEEIGAKLFERSTRSVSLTAAGERLYSECKKIFEVMDALPQLVRDEEAEFKGYMQFGISDSMSQHVLPKVLQQFQKQHPLVVSSVVMGPAQHMLQKVEAGGLEFALLFSESRSGLDLEFIPFLKIQFYIVAATRIRENPEAMRSFIAAREIEDGRLEDFKEWSLVKSLIPGVRIQYSANSYFLHKEMVMSGCGVSMFPSYLVNEELRKNRLFVLNKQKPLVGTLQLVKRRGRPLSAKATSFLELLKTHLQT